MKQLFGIVAILSISACGGGSTVGTQTGQQNSPSFAAVGPNATVTLDGTSVSGAYTSDTSGNLASFVGTAARVGTSDTADVTLINSAISALAVNAGAGSVDFDGSAGDVAKSGSINNLLFFSTRRNGRTHLFAIDPNVAGFNYQMPGAWFTGGNFNAGQAGAGSFGWVTPDGAANVGSSASYSGSYVGMKGTTGGVVFLTKGTADMFVNFQSGLFDLYTNETSSVDFHNGPAPSASSANFNGVLNGSSFTDTPRSGTGSVNGNFFGPSGEEVGGSFNVTTGSTTSLGAFGATRQSVTP